jgi:hypothetical protein
LLRRPVLALLAGVPECRGRRAARDLHIHVTVGYLVSAGLVDDRWLNAFGGRWLNAFAARSSSPHGSAPVAARPTALA